MKMLFIQTNWLLLSNVLKIKLQLIVVALFLFKNTCSQNLILNPSFEDYTDPIECNGGGGFYNYSVFPFTHVVNNWEIYSSPDYFNTVCPSWSEYNNSNVFGYSISKEGNAYAGFITYLQAGNTKEYIYQQLQSPLQGGKTYCLSFYTSLADNMNYAVANIGAYFCSIGYKTISIYYLWGNINVGTTY